MAKTEVQPNDLVYFKHDMSGDHAPAITTVEAFDELWKAKKWYLTDGTGQKVNTAAKALVNNPEEAAAVEPAAAGGVS